MEVAQGSYIKDNIYNIINAQKTWRGNRNILKAFDETNNIKYLLKDVTISKVNEDQQTDLAQLMVEFKKYLPTYEGTVTHNERDFQIFRKEGKSFSKWLYQQSLPLDQKRISRILLQFIEISEIFNRLGNNRFYLADQIPSAFSILENDELRMIPLLISNNQFKQHVYCEYVKTLTNEVILFPYPPETLEEATRFEINPTFIERGYKLDIWAIGTFLQQVLRGLTEEKSQLEGNEDLKSPQQQEQQQSICLNDLILLMLQTNPASRLTLKELKESVLKINNNVLIQQDNLQSTEIFQKKIIQVIKNANPKQNISYTNLSLDEAISDMLNAQEQFNPQGKWHSCVLKMVSTEEVNLSKSDKSLLYLSIKQCLDSIMNHFSIQIELNKSDQAVQYIPQTVKQLSILKELEINYSRALINPIEFDLINFFFSAEQQAQQSSQDLELKDCIHLAGRQILKAIVSSKNLKKAIQFCKHILTRDFNDIEVMLICAQCYLKLKSKEALQYVNQVLQLEPKNSSALFFKAKFYKSLKNDGASAIKILNLCLHEAQKENKTISLDYNIPYYPSNYRVRYELGKLYWKLNNQRKYIENFKACLSLPIKTKDDNKMKTNSLKILLLYYLNEMDNQQIQDIKKDQIRFASSSKDPDLCALLSESVLVSLSHPQLAMHFVEQGLQARLFNQDEKIDENSKIQIIPQNFGCLIQQAKINFKIGRNPQDIIDFLLKLKQEMDKISKQKRQQVDDIKDSLKVQEKKGFSVEINWNYYLDMILLEIYIEIRNINKAEKILQEAVKYKEKRSQCERAHWKAVLILKKGNIQSAITRLKDNLAYGPSCYLLGIEYLKDDEQLKNAQDSFEKALVLSPKNILYFQAVTNIKWGQRSTFNSLSLFSSYLEEIQNENRILKQLHKRRLRYPQRKINYDSLSIARLGRCLFQKGQSRYALRILKFSLRLNNQESLTLLWYSEVLFQRKKYSQAKIFLEQIPEKDANNEDYYFLLGMSQIKTGNQAIGKELLMKIQKISKFKKYYDLIKLLGEESFKQKDFQKALEYYEQCVKIKKLDSQVLSSMGYCYLEIKNYQYAKNYFLISLEVKKENAVLFQSLINVYEILKETPDLKLMVSYESNFLNNRKILNYLGQVYFEAGSSDPKFYLVSMKYYNLLNKQLSSSSLRDLFQYQVSFLRLAQLSYLQREFTESLQFMKSFSVSKLSDNPTEEQTQQMSALLYEAYFFQAQFYSYMGENKLSSKFIFKCIKMKPKNGYLYLKLAFYLLSQQSKAAWKYFEKGMALMEDQDNEQEDILVLKSLQGIQNGKTKEAKKFLTKCAYLHKSSEKCLYFLGYLHSQEKQYDQAIIFYNNCIDMSQTVLPSLDSLILSKEERIDCFISLGKAHTKVNKLFEASDTMKKCLKLFPEDSKVLSNISQLQFKQGSSSEANLSANSSILSGSCDVRTYYILAVTSMRIGCKFQTIQALKRCIQLQPNYKQVQLKLGHIYASISRPKLALQYYLQHLSNSPKSAQGLVHSSKLLAYFKQFSLAQSHLDRLFVEIQENKSQYNHNDLYIKGKHSYSKESVLENEYYLDDKYVRLEEAYAIQGFLWLQQNNLTEAIVFYEKAIQLNPNNQAIKYSLAFVCSQLGHFKQEIKIYKELLKQEQSAQGQLNIKLNLGLAYQKAGKIQKAIQTYETAEIDSSFKCSTNLLANFGALLLESKETQKAIRFLSEAIEIDINHTESLFLLGLAFQDKGDYSSSSKFFERSISSNVCFVPSYLQLSSLKWKLGKHSESISVCQSALTNCSSKERILLFLGNIYLKTNDFWTTLATFEQLLAIIPNSKEEQNLSKQNNDLVIQCNLSIARVYRKLHEDEKAIDFLKNNCLNNYPDQPEYLHELGSILIHHKTDQIEALKLLKQAVNARPDNAIFNFSLANALHHLHQYELEIEILNKCLELSSDFKLKIYNNLAIAFQLTHNGIKALKTYQTAIQQFPDVANLYFNLGNYYQSFRKLVQAVESYRTCILKDPSHFEALHNLAVVSVQLKDFQSAVNYFSRCMQLHPEQRLIYYPKIAILLQRGYSVHEV